MGWSTVGWARRAAAEGREGGLSPALPRKLATLALLAALIGPAAAAAAGDPAMLARYQRAAEIQGAQAHRWFLNVTVEPHWIAGQDRFWYRRDTAGGHRFVVFDARSGSRSDLFDHAALARALGAALGRPLDAEQLPLYGLQVDPGAGLTGFSAFGRDWRLGAAGELTAAPFRRGELAMSPDGRLGAFARDGNLWVRDLVSGAARQLTFDGTADLAYGAPASVLARPGAPPRVIWSPSSQRLLTVKTDERGVGDMPLVAFAPAGSARPQVVHSRVALPGDATVTRFSLLIIDAADGRQTPIRFAAMPSARMMVDTPADEGRSWWRADGAQIYFLAIDRGEKTVHVEAADAASGETRELFAETSDIAVELGPDIYAAPAVRYLPKSDQLIWYSERSGWAQLYLYDLASGKLIRPLTTGAGLVRNILGVDEARRRVFVALAGRTPGADPYDQEIGRVDLDSGRLTLLSAGGGDHQVFVAGSALASATESLDLAAGQGRAGYGGVSPSGGYVLEKLTTAAGPGRTVLRRADGALAGMVEAADASRAPPYWRWPQPVRLKAADGVTDIDALVFRPSDLDTAKSYPVIDVAYGGPQEAVVPRGWGEDFFRDSAYFLDPASLAELGFIAVVIDGRGSSERSRAFRAWSYGHIERASDPADHVAAIRQLAALYPYMDAGRVGITGFSGGGYLTAAAMLSFPEFFKVGVAGDGNHDQRLLPHSWGERYEGYPLDAGWADQANAAHAANLKGRLLLIHGLEDSGVNPAATLQFEQALIEAGKSFDMLLLPRGRHQLSGYGARRTWDYFVERLAGATPPTDFPLTSYLDYRDAEMAQAAGAAK